MRAKSREIDEPTAHHLMVVAVRQHALPASKLLRLVEEWDHPQFPEFRDRTAWSLYNAFSLVQKSRRPWDQMEGTLRISSLFRRELALN